MQAIRWNWRDGLTGLSMAGLVLPQVVAYAGIAGLSPGRALTASIAGGLLYALVGRSRFAIVSPTSSSAAILAASIAGLTATSLGTEPAGAGADPAMKDAIATALTALAGLLFAVLALFRLGSLSGFISRPVLRGFTFGLSITIASTQLPALFGVRLPSGSVWGVLAGVAEAMPRWNPPSLLLGAAAFAALVALRRAPQWPGALLVIAGGIAFSLMVDPARWGIELAGPVTLTAAGLTLPPLAMLPRLMQLAAPIALILFAESWGTMRSLALKHGDTIDANRELGALGLANIAAAVAQGMPVGAGFSAGAANEAAGSTSRLTGAVAALALAGFAIFAGHWIALIPKPVLAAVVVAALTHALSPRPLLHLFHIDRDQWIALTAALGVLGLGVLDGMLAAIALSITHLLYQLSHPSISELGRLEDSHDFVDIARHHDAHPLPGLTIFRPNAPLGFTNAEACLHAIAIKAKAPVVILSLEESYDLDATAIEALGDFMQALVNNGQQLILARAHDRVRDVLTLAGFGELAAGSTYSVADATQRIASGADR